jgi:hypothetical protein
MKRFWGRQVLALVFGAFFALAGGGVAASDDNEAKGSITFDVIQCPQGRAEMPQASIRSLADLESKNPNAFTFPAHLGYGAIRAVSRQRVEDGYFRVTYAIEQGTYLFRLRSPHCEASYIHATVLGGHARVVSLATRNQFNGFDDRIMAGFNAVAGSLAIHPSAGWLVGAKGQPIPLVLQDGAYYGEGFDPDKYFLRFDLTDGERAELPLSVSPRGSAQFVRQDISAAAFRENIVCVINGKDHRGWNYCGKF